MTQHHLGGRMGDSFRFGTTVLLLVGLAGCSKTTPFDPSESQGALATSRADPVAAGYGSSDFYPLATGNTWNYEGEFRSRFVNPDGSPAGGDIVIQNDEAHRILGTTTYGGRSYYVREEVLDQSSDLYSGTYVSWSLMRQDRTGLFAADVSPTEPPVLDGDASRRNIPNAISERPRLDPAVWEARGLSKESAARFVERFERLRDAARGWGRSADARASDDAELTWLLYPLRPGVEWNIRPDMPWPATVAGVEVMNSPIGRLVAYRIETNPLGEPFPEGEYVRLYYGRVGYVGYSIHLSFAATDENGDPTGVTVVADDARRLVSTGPNS